MKKLVTFNENNVSKKAVWFCGVISTIIISFLSWQIMKLLGLDFSLIQALKTLSPLDIIIYLLIALSAIVIHELIHAVLFILFGKGQAKIRIERNKKHGTIVVHQKNEKVFYSKLETIIILLAPCLIVNLLCLLSMFVLAKPLLLYVVLILNSLGSCIDIYLSIIVSRFPSNCKINYGKDEICMNIYVND